MNPDVSQATQFLTDLFTGLPKQARICIWTIPDKLSRWYSAVPKQEVFVGLVSEHKDVYFGLSACPAGLKQTVRLKSHESVGIFDAWIDIDFGDTHKKKNLPATLEEAITLANEAVGLEPTYIIASGHGIHGHWLFDKPWLFAEKEEWKRAELFMQRFNQLFKNKAGEHGWHIDSTFDLARVLRVPGTLNFKDDEPKEVKIVACSGARYSIQDIQSRLPSLPENETALREKTKTAVKATVGNIVLRSDAIYPADKFDALCSNNDDFQATWEHKRKLKDMSPSGWDMSLACFVARANWTDQEIVNLLIHGRTKWNYDLKFHRPDYYAATVAKARQLVKNTRVMDELEAMSIGDTGEDTPPQDKRLRVLGLLSEAFGVRIVNIKKFLLDPPEYALETEKGTLTLRKVDQLVSQAQFRYSLAGACDIVIPQYKSNEWRVIAQQLLDACENIEMDGEVKEGNAILDLLKSYVAAKKPIDDRDMAFKSKMPFQQEKRIYIFVTDFSRWLRLSFLGNYGVKELGKLLRIIGGEVKTMNFRIDGARTSSYVWMLPKEDFHGFVRE